MTPSPNPAEVTRYIDEVAERAEGRGGAISDVVVPSLPTGGTGIHQPAVAAHLGVARDHAHMGTQVPPQARLRSAKQLVVTAMRPVTSYQVTVNFELVAAIGELLAAVEEVEATNHAGLRRLAEALASSQAEVREAQQAQLASEARVAEVIGRLEARLDAQDAEIGRLREQLRTEGRLLRSRQDIILRAAREALPGGMSDGGLTSLSRELDHTYDDLYQDLEATFRGTHTEVRAMVEGYLPDVETAGRGPVVDIGCGRGEWLEVLRDHGIPAYGIDLNAEFVANLVERGLDVRHGDALAHLRDLPEGTLRAVTGHHLAEHLSLETLVELVDAALHALEPGGVLILETPNPTNLRVGAASFYLDPTHLKPLHPQFLQFLVTARGFVDAEVRFLHEPEGPRLDADALGGGVAGTHLAEDLNWALYGPMDYAVVARKVSATPITAEAHAASPGEQPQP